MQAGVEHWLAKILRRHMRLGGKTCWQSMLVGGDSHRLRLDILLCLLSNFDLASSLVVVPASAIHPAVPPVLHRVVASAAQSPRDFRPPLAHLGNHLLDCQTLLGCDWIMVQVWFEVLVEALPTLLGRAGLDCL